MPADKAGHPATDIPVSETMRHHIDGVGMEVTPYLWKYFHIFQAVLWGKHRENKRTKMASKLQYYKVIVSNGYLTVFEEVRALRNCWEFMKCGMEKGGEKARLLGVCPAYPDQGKICAHVVGNLCNTAGIISKAEDCRKCEFYNSDHFDKRHSGFVFNPMRSIKS